MKKRENYQTYNVAAVDTDNEELRVIKSSKKNAKNVIFQGTASFVDIHEVILYHPQKII